VPPGQEGKIELAVEHTQGYTGEIAKSANVTTNDPKHPTFSLVLRARFRIEGQPPLPPPPASLNPNAVFTVEPSDRWITSAITGSSSANTFYLYNPKETPVHLKKVITGGTDFTAKLEPIQDGKRYQLSVASNPTLKPGHYLQKVQIETDSTVQPVVNVELDVTVYPKVFVSPPSIIMPQLPIGTDLERISWPMIYVRKIREQGLKIKSYNSTLPFLKLELITDTDGQVYHLKLTLDATKVKPGAFNGKVHIETNEPEVSVIEVPVQGSFK
jgi:hypothetical protein